MIDNCAAVETLMARAAEGRLSPADQARLDAHLERCASCRAALVDQRAMRELLQGYPMEGARLGFDTRVMGAIRAEAESRSASWLAPAPINTDPRSRRRHDEPAARHSPRGALHPR